MRVLMLSDYYPPHVGGGVEKVVSEICPRLVQRGHDVAVVTLKTVPAPDVETSDHFTIFRISALDLTPKLGLQQALSPLIMPAIFQRIRAFKPDVIHAHNLFFRTTEVAALLRTLFPVPLVTTLHLGEMKGGSRLLRTLVKSYEFTVGRFIARQSSHITTVSEAVAQYSRSMIGNTTPVSVVPNGVDTSAFHPAFERNGVEPTILFVGRLIQNKGPEVLVEAVPQILSNHPNARIIFAGDGPMKAQLVQLAEQLGVGHAIDFLGLRHDVPELMRKATLFVRPSTLEGMPLTVLEAMASALPVVATPVGGTPELIKDKECGHLVPVGDSAALANASISLLNDRSMAESMGNRGYDMVVNKHTWEVVAQKTEHVYEEVVNRRFVPVSQREELADASVNLFGNQSQAEKTLIGRETASDAYACGMVAEGVQQRVHEKEANRQWVNAIQSELYEWESLAPDGLPQPVISRPTSEIEERK
ncbi:MAG: glycosyltransferase family 4 protein [Planctomycetes bacterium]|nr:glycosyltransferase family 4 protein [Planctomycetota bacterium]